MKLTNPDLDFIIIGENIHTTRVIMRRGKLVTTTDDRVAAIRNRTVNNEPRLLPIPEDAKKTQDFEEGRVKHMKIAIQAAMSDDDSLSEIGLGYLRRQLQRQEVAGADFLDLNVDELSIKLEEQKAGITWLVNTVQSMTQLPVSVDSSNPDIIEAGLEATERGGSRARPLLNSASLERLEALDMVVKYNARVVVTASGESGMPQTAEERVENASRVIDTAIEKGIAVSDIFVDPLYFPVSVDGRFGIHAFESIRQLRAKYGPDIHISGGMSNVSFGIPSRKMINDVFMILAVEAGADSGIIDPVTSRPNEVFGLDRNSEPFKLAEEVLMGRDEHCANYIRAWRNGELGDSGPQPRKKKKVKA